MMLQWCSRLCALLLLWTLAACSSVPAEDPKPYRSSRPPLVLAVDQVEVANQSRVPFDTSFIDKRRSRELADTAAAFLRSRIQAGGGPGAARVVIERATLIERPRKKKESGLAGLFVRESDRILEGDLAVRVSVVDPEGFERAFARAEVRRLKPVIEGSSVIQRDRLARQLMRDLMAQIDNALQEAIEQNLAAYLQL